MHEYLEKKQKLSDEDENLQKKIQKSLYEKLLEHYQKY